MNKYLTFSFMASVILVVAIDGTLIYCLRLVLEKEMIFSPFEVMRLRFILLYCLTNWTIAFSLLNFVNLILIIHPLLLDLNEFILSF